MADQHGPERTPQMVYMLLDRHPSWSYQDIARALDISATRARSICESLHELGLLATSSGSPESYATVDPEVALSRLFEAEERHTSSHLRQLDRIRGQIHTLMGDFMRLRAGRREDAQVEKLEGADRVNAFLNGAASLVRRRMCAVHTGGPPPRELMDDMLMRDKEVVDRGVRIQALYLRNLSNTRYRSQYLDNVARLGIEVRLATHLPLRMLIYDDDLALLPIDPENSALGAFAIRSLELVRCLQLFFDYCWVMSTPQYDLSGTTALKLGLSDQDMAIIRLLAAGVKDDAISRQLGISPRTLSRAIALLLERLGVQTRFQAALRIAEVGFVHDAPFAKEFSVGGEASSSTAEGNVCRRRRKSQASPTPCLRRDLK